MCVQLLKAALFSVKSVRGQTCRAEFWGRYVAGAGLFRKFQFSLRHVNNCLIRARHNLSVTDFTSERHPPRPTGTKIWVMPKQAEECVPRRLVCSLHRLTVACCRAQSNATQSEIRLKADCYGLFEFSIWKDFVKVWSPVDLSHHDGALLLLPKCWQRALMVTPGPQN